MKKLIMASMLCLMSTIICFGQITIVSNGETKNNNYIVKDMYSSLRIENGCYVYFIKDTESTNSIKIKLGETNEDAVETLTTLYGWFSSANNKEYIEFDNGFGDIITMYKYSSTIPYFSTCDVESLKEYIKIAMMTSFAGGSRKRISNNNYMIGWMANISQMKKAINALS